MYFIIYLSASTGWLSETDLQQILDVSIVNNRRDGLTGMLLYADGNFIQLLEGEESTVKAAYNRINADPRHGGVTQVAGGMLNSRNFPAWAMGFKSVDKNSTAPFINLPGTGTDSHISVTLLKAFMKTARM